MDILLSLLDFFLHLDVHLSALIASYGVWVYGILFLIIFAETGFVIMPFLPGDSLLFAAGAFAATGSFHVMWLFVLLTVAAIIGDSVNYWIGHKLGPRVFKENVRFLKKEYLTRTEAFYEKHGGKTIIIARFMPIIRTFAPFIAGIGKMRYGSFIAYNIFGGVLWIGLFVFGGYFFGNISVIKENFEYVIIGIIILSLAPGVVHYIKSKMAAKAGAQPVAQEDNKEKIS
ncbi:MAG: hypothetical protein A3F54_03260 [Candidatus Kerfeldbacteria bacterium RIFCSPHIGHO2_12_FULL_48_17]|uniref:VTT domain-containing protein n=1 Tax=Candidatus Kerfeldbacteria bacterium RIFCSPHIGHO2_12_FULL_48_17 TaxID=1798542 RepID=A0A1G2B7U6_9BACT|nr:MAG: hypothetical protein A3F54_03260 [Candidatus Kerfeldbacteria bacterium RIFCSPHIGHO2_12_FULL_48_17]